MDQRIRVICRYCDRFPTVKTKGYFDDDEIKHFIYQAMPTGLQQVFDQSGKTWFDDNLSRVEMVNCFHNVHTSYQHKQELKRKNQNQQDQRPNKRINSISARQYNAFLQWKSLNMNQRVSNNNYQPSRHSTQRPLNLQQRTPIQTRQQTRQNTNQRSNSSGRNPQTHRNNNNNNNSNSRRPTNNPARRLFNSNDQYFNEEDKYEQQNDQPNNIDYNDHYFNDDLPQEPENNHDPDEYINDDSFQRSQGDNEDDMYFSEFFDGNYE